MIFLPSFFIIVYFNCFACTFTRFFRRVGRSRAPGASLLTCTSNLAQPSYLWGLCLVKALAAPPSLRTQRSRPALCLKHLGQGRASMPTPMERPV